MQISILLGSVVPFIVICAVFAALLFHRAARAHLLILGRFGLPLDMRDVLELMLVVHLHVWHYRVFSRNDSYGRGLSGLWRHRYAIAFRWPLILGPTLLEKPSLDFPDDPATPRGRRRRMSRDRWNCAAIRTILGYILTNVLRTKVDASR